MPWFRKGNCFGQGEAQIVLAQLHQLAARPPAGQLQGGVLARKQHQAHLRRLGIQQQVERLVQHRVGDGVEIVQRQNKRPGGFRQVVCQQGDHLFQVHARQLEQRQGFISGSGHDRLQRRRSGRRRSAPAGCRARPARPIRTGQARADQPLHHHGGLSGPGRGGDQRSPAAFFADCIQPPQQARPLHQLRAGRWNKELGLLQGCAHLLYFTRNFNAAGAYRGPRKPR